MWAITLNGKPATLEQLAEAQEEYRTCSAEPSIIREAYFSAKLKKQAIRIYIYYFGWTWKERAKGIEVMKVYYPKRRS